jgi:hypothetical protein
MHSEEPDPNMLLVFSRAIQRFDNAKLLETWERFTAAGEHPTVMLVLEGEVARREIVGRRL